MENKDVFISYKSEEFDEAEWVRSTLESNGVSCWMAPASISGGSNYAVEIPKAIRNCKVFVLILSEKAQLSKWVPRELDQAINEEKIILPFMLDNCSLKDDFNFYLSNIQRYAAYEDKTAAIDKMLIRIKTILSSNEKPDADKSVESEGKKTDKFEKKPISNNKKDESRIIPDIPEILKEKEQPRKKNKNKAILAVCFAALLSLIVIGIISSVLNTVEIAGRKYKKNDTTVSVYDAQLSAEDIEAIKKMKSVSYINLSNCTLPDTDLSWITDTTTLSLENCGLTDEHLKTIDFASLDLSSLDIDGNKGVTDLSALTYVSDTLKTVSFNSCSVSDISFANQLLKLSSLYADSNGISDISALDECTKLQIISLNDNNIDSLGLLSDCSELREIYVNSNKLTSLNGLEKAIRLEIIEADSNKIIDFSGLANTTVLKTVSLKNNNSSDKELLSGVLVKSCETMKELHLDDNAFVDFESVGELKLLKILTLDNCKNLSSLEFLKDLTLIERFSAQDCSVSSLSGLENCQSLTYLDLSDNDISSLDYLPDFNSSNVYLDLSNNLLTAVSLPEQSFSTLSLFGNNILTLDIAETSGGEIVVGYCDGFDYGTLSKKYYDYKLIDIPLDKQVSVGQAINSYSLKFLSADEYIDSLNN